MFATALFASKPPQNMANVFLPTTNELNLALLRSTQSIQMVWGEKNSLHAIASETHYDTPKPIVGCSRSELIKRDSSSTPERSSSIVMARESGTLHGYDG